MPDVWSLAPTCQSSSAKGRRSVQPQERNGLGWPLVQAVSHPETHEERMNGVGQIKINDRYKCPSAADTLLRRLVLL